MTDISLKMHQIQFRLGLTELTQLPVSILGKEKEKEKGRDKGKARKVREGKM